METYINYQQLSQMIGIKPSTLYSMVSKKLIPHVRVSKRLVIFNLKEVQEWLAANEVKS